MIGGDWKVVDGQIPHIDEADLIQRHTQAARELRVRSGLAT